MAIPLHSLPIICLPKIILQFCSFQHDFLEEIWITVSSPTDNKDPVPEQDSKQQSKQADKSNQLMMSLESEWSEEK